MFGFGVFGEMLFADSTASAFVGAQTWVEQCPTADTWQKQIVAIGAWTDQEKADGVWESKNKRTSEVKKCQ